MLEKSHYNNKYPNTGKKGVVDYETISELLEYNQAIPAQETDKAYVKETNSFYDWRVGDNSVADGVNIIAQKSGKGRWVKIGNTENNFIPPPVQNTPQTTLFFDDKGEFPLEGEVDKLYISKDNGISWTWNGTEFVSADGEQRICLNTATPPFIQTIVTGQQGIELYFLYEGNPFDITSFKINGTELLTGNINIYNSEGDYIYTNQLVPLFNAYMTTNGYTGTIYDGIDNEGGVFFLALAGMTTPLTFEIITDEGGNINTYTQTSSLINTPTVADLNNPTKAEVQAYVTTNNINTNGTQLVYFVEGDGGSCDNPDYVWTINDGEVTLSNKRVFNTKTVYVDAGSGSDVTGRRGYREFPFKTLNAAIVVTQTGDLLKVFPGDYTQTTTIQNLINIDCDNGVNWLVNTGTFIATANFANVVNVKWNFYKLYGAIAREIRFSNSLGEIEINAYEFNLIDFISNVKKDYSKITNLINSRYVPRTIIGTGTEVGWTTVIDNLERTVSQNYQNFSVQGKDLSKGYVHIKNLKSINSLTGYGNAPTIGYFFSSDVGINKQYTTIIDNATHDDPNIYVTPPGPLADVVSWRGTSAGEHAGLLVSTGSAHRTGSTINLDIKDIKSTGHGVRVASNGTGDNITVNVKIKGVFEKGVPIYTHFLQNITNSKIIIDLDVECYTSMGLFLGFFPAGSGENNIHASNQVIVTGRIKTRYAGMSCISIGTGSAASNNTNGTILLKDLTLINDGLVSPIMCAVPENVQIQNVVTNSLTTDPNITEVGQSIIRNINYK